MTQFLIFAIIGCLGWFGGEKAFSADDGKADSCGHKGHDCRILDNLPCKSEREALCKAQEDAKLCVAVLTCCTMKNAKPDAPPLCLACKGCCDKWLKVMEADLNVLKCLNPNSPPPKDSKWKCDGQSKSLEKSCDIKTKSPGLRP